ncbi:RNA polymerase sigma factor [Paenibacillus sp. strain BS8-2]
MEQEIIGRIVQGDRDAFRLLYDEHFDYAMRTAIYVTRHNERAKDAVQETFLRVYRSIGQYDPSKPFKPWLYCILLRECYRVMEREQKIVPIGGQLELERLGVEPEKPDTSLDLYDALQTLPDMYRIPLILKYVHHYSEQELADMLELNVNTLKSRLHKGREKMRDRLGGESYGSEI